MSRALFLNVTDHEISWGALNNIDIPAPFLEILT